MPETLNGDETQINLANVASVDVAAAGEYRRRLNSLVVPFQRVAHWLEALREKVNLIEPLTTRVADLESLPGNSGKRITFLTDPPSGSGTNAESLERIYLDAGGGSADEIQERSIGAAAGAGVDYILPELDQVPVGVTEIILHVTLFTRDYNWGALYLGIAADLYSLDPVAMFVGFQGFDMNAALQTGDAVTNAAVAPFVVVRLDSNGRFKLRLRTSGASTIVVERIGYRLTLLGYLR